MGRRGTGRDRGCRMPCEITSRISGIVTFAERASAEPGFRADVRSCRHTWPRSSGKLHLTMSRIALGLNPQATVTSPRPLDLVFDNRRSGGF